MNVLFPLTRRRMAFTLIELVVSMLVLTVLVVIVAQLTNQTSTISARSQDKMDMDNQARLALDRIEADLARMLKRKDVNYIFFKPSSSSLEASDAMFFYSESPAYFNTTPNPAGLTNRSSLALVGYRINSDFQLQRLCKSLSWDGVSNASSAQGIDPGAMVFLTYQAGSTNLVAGSLAGNWPSIGTASDAYKDVVSKSEGTDFDYRVLGAQVFRLEICFQVNGQARNADGTPHFYYSTRPTDPKVTITTLPTSSAIYNMSSGSMQGFPTELVAVVTTIAMLDNTTILQNPGLSLQATGKALPKVVDGALLTTAQQKPLPGQVWQTAVDGGLLPDGNTLAADFNVPQTVIGKIRVYQRVTYLSLQ